jgi:hypothetical protein
MSREATTKLLEEIAEGILDRDAVILACVNYMSEADVADMCRVNEFFPDEDEDECEGHPAGPFDPMGQTVYCDGSCR